MSSEACRSLIDRTEKSLLPRWDVRTTRAAHTHDRTNGLMDDAPLIVEIDFLRLQRRHDQVEWVFLQHENTEDILGHRHSPS